MPVIREQRRANLSLSGGGVVSIESGAGTLAAVGDAAGRVASQLGGLMGDMAQDEAAALASTVELDGSGNVVLPADVQTRERMGYVAGRAYDRTVRQRQGQRIQTGISQSVARVRDEFQYDSGAFLEAAEALREGILAAAPEEMRGAADDFLRAEIAQQAGRIGWNEAQLQRSQTASSFNADARTAAERAWMASLANDPETAAAENARTRAVGDDLLRRGVITPEAYRRGIVMGEAAVGAAGLLAEATAEEWGAAKLYETADALIMGRDQALNERFPDDDTRMEVARRITVRAGRLAGAERERRASAQRAEDISLVLRGAAEATDANRERLDDAIEMVTGTRIQPEDWLSGDMMDPTLWRQIRVSGMPPASLVGAFRMFARGNASPEQRDAAMMMWSELSRGRAPDGSPSDLAGQLPDDAVSVLSLTEALQASGYPAERAYATAAELGAAPIDREALAVRMNGGALFSRAQALVLGRDRPVLPENVDSVVRAGLRDAIVDRLDATVSARDLNTAQTVFSLLVVGGTDPEDAMTMVTRQMERRMPETSYIYEGVQVGWRARSAQAPEKHFAMPAEGFFSGIAQSLGMAPTWFQQYASDQIKSRIADGVALSDGVLRPGQGGDYSLQPDPRATGTPVYIVMVDPDGDGPLGPQPAFDKQGGYLVLDPGPAYRAARQEQGDRQLAEARAEQPDRIAREEALIEEGRVQGTPGTDEIMDMMEEQP